MKLFDLSGKVAIVTGCNTGLGQGMAIALAQAGADIVGVNTTAPTETAATVTALGRRFHAIAANLAEIPGLESVVEEACQTLGRLDILVNNAGGLFARKTLQELDEPFYDLVMNVNFKATVFVMQAFEPLMGKGASIINLSSQAARDGGGGGSSLYASSKGAVTTFTRAMAKELGPKGIRVNAVCPGLIATKFHDDFTKDEVRKMVSDKTPLRREGGAEEVAGLVAYLASDNSSFVNGANFDINGGLAFS